MDPQDSFAEVERRIREGNQDAATEVFRRFAGKLIGLAYTKLDIRIRRKEDPKDVVQSVFRSFFSRHRDGEYDLTTWGSLWSLLTVITVRKCRSRANYYGAKRRDIKLEVNVEDARNEVLDRDPTTREAEVLAETIKEVMGDLEADDRTIIEMSLQGCTVREISKHLALSERTIGRVRERIKKRLQRMQAEETDAA